MSKREEGNEAMKREIKKELDVSLGLCIVDDIRTNRIIIEDLQDLPQATETIQLLTDEIARYYKELMEYVEK